MKKLTVFLSYSSSDRAFVRRLNKDLKSRFVDTWMDEERISPGGSITTEIQRGLDSADVIFVFLSQHSVSSQWVTNEWQAKYSQQVTDRRISVVPIVLSDCQIPTFLADRRYVDFRKKEEYETNLSELLSFLENIKLETLPEKEINFRDFGKIFDYTKEILDDIALEQISLPMHKRLPIIDTLKKIARSGKKVRLQDFKPPVRIRSVFDHLLSLAHLADCLLPHINHGIHESELGDISLCIAYHELNEVVLGDIPTYTSLNTYRRNMARIFAEERLRNVDPARREKIANEFIWMFLSEKHRKAFEAAMKIITDPHSKTNIIFKALDKMDPIVATWRYLHHYRGKLGDTPREFNSRMKDFYENPDVKAFLRAHKTDTKLVDFVINLQDRRNAWDYYEDPNRIFGDDRLFEMPKSAVRNAIEGIALFEA